MAFTPLWDMAPDWENVTPTQDWDTNFTTPPDPCATPPRQIQSQLYEFIILGVLQGSFTFFGIFGNLISFLVWSGERKSTSTNFMFRFLALVDTLFLIIILIYSILPTINGYTGSIPGYHDFLLILLPYIWPLLWTVKALAVWTVVMITLDRYRAVCFPIKSRTENSLFRVKIGCVFLIFMVVVYNLPHWLEIESVSVRDPCTNEVKTKAAYTDLLVENRLYNILYVTLGEVLVYFTIPLIILIFCTVKLVRTLRNAIKARKSMMRTSGNARNQNSKSVTRMLIAIILIFIVCESPQFVYSVMYFAATVDSSATVYKFFFLDPENYYYISMYRAFGDFLFTFQSCVNFFVYCIYGRRFRKILWNKVTCTREDVTPKKSVNVECTSRVTAVTVIPGESNEDDDWPDPPTQAELYPMTNQDLSVWSTEESGQTNPSYVADDFDPDSKILPHNKFENEDDSQPSIVVLTNEVIKDWEANPKYENLPLSTFQRGVVFLKRLSRRRFKSENDYAHRKQEQTEQEIEPRSQSLKSRDRDSVDKGYESLERDSNLLQLMRESDFPEGTTIHV